jgi:hypothetical protein
MFSFNYLNLVSNSIEIVSYKWKKFHITKNIYLTQYEISESSYQSYAKRYEDVGK